MPGLMDLVEDQLQGGGAGQNQDNIGKHLLADARQQPFPEEGSGDDDRQHGCIEDERARIDHRFGWQHQA